MDSEPGELLALFNSASLLEIAIAQGNAAELLGLEPGTSVKIKFDYDQQRGNSAILQPPA
jgi:S-adenosylmethionine hydrolase